jgi:drug/metabolite transporter (DMT)-like permease
LGFLKTSGINIWGKNHKILILRGLSGSVALILYYRLIQDIPLATATTILFLSPIFATVLGIFFVGETVKPLQWLFFLLSFGGIVMIKGFDTRIALIYLLMGVASSLFSGVAYNCIRKLKNSEHPLVIIFYFPLVTLPITGIWSTFIWVWPKGMDWLILMMVGLLTQIAQYFMTRAFQGEELSKVASLRYLGIIYALIFGYMFFDEHFTPLVYAGMGFTVIGVLLNIWYKHTQLQADKRIFRGKLMN